MARRLARSTAAVLAAVLVQSTGSRSPPTLGPPSASPSGRSATPPSSAPPGPGSSAAARDLGAVRARLQRPRREALRLLRVVADEGFPALVLSTVTILGPAETSFALDQGATGVVLIGYSMGGLWPSASCTSRSWRPRFAG
jgi:hypothetical protein